MTFRQDYLQHSRFYSGSRLFLRLSRASWSLFVLKYLTRDYFKLLVFFSLFDLPCFCAPCEIVPCEAITARVRAGSAWETFLLRATSSPSQPTSRLYQLKKGGDRCSLTEAYARREF